MTGTWNSAFGFSEEECRADDWHYVADRLQAGTVRPEELITHHFPLERLEEGLKIMRDKTEDYCKIMIHPDRSL